MSEDKNSGAFVWGFVAGAAAAAVYTLLKAPRSGHETIEQLKGQGVKLKTRAEEMAGDLMHRGEETASDWQQAAHSGWQQTADTGPQYWQADLADTTQDAKAAAEDVVGQIQEQAAEAMDAAQAEVADAVETVQNDAVSAVEQAEDVFKS